jgi:hypothetical protein
VKTDVVCWILVRKSFPPVSLLIVDKSVKKTIYCFFYCKDYFFKIIIPPQSQFEYIEKGVAGCIQ